MQRLRRLVERADRRLQGRHKLVHAALALFGLALIAALAAAAWPIVGELRSEQAAAADPRPAYVSRVRERIQQATQAALAQAPNQDWSGMLKLRLEIDPQGALTSARVVERSGHAALDAFALGIVRSAAPFEPFPADMRRLTTAVEITSELEFHHAGPRGIEPRTAHGNKATR